MVGAYTFHVKARIQLVNIKSLFTMWPPEMKLRLSFGSEYLWILSQAISGSALLGGRCLGDEKEESIPGVPGFQNFDPVMKLIPFSQPPP